MVKTCAKINLGLNVISRRDDGYHNIETVFLPIPLYDYLDLTTQHDDTSPRCNLTIAGEQIDCANQQNLVVKAYNLLAEHFPLPAVHITLSKHIPSQAGLGGGSSDAAAMVRMLNEQCHLNLSASQMQRYAATLGADCAFFIQSRTAYAEGIGEKLYHIPGIQNQLLGMKIAIVKPHVNISTHEAFTHITPHYPPKNCLETVLQPVETWKNELINDFEQYALAKYTELQEIKKSLYRLSALYVSLAGSGSAIYGIMPADTTLTRLQLRHIFPECFTSLLTITANTD